MTKWLQVHVECLAHESDDIIELLEGLGACAIDIRGNGEQNCFSITPNDYPLWDNLHISSLFSPSIHSGPIIEACIQRSFPDARLSHGFLKDKDWVKITQENFPPQCFNQQLWIYPSHYEGKHEPCSFVIQPGHAFGTGTHPTTKLCIEALCQLELNNKSVLDLGCGSGILALSAKSLGADAIFAIDHDPQAVSSCINNFKLNPKLHYDTHIHLDSETTPPPCHVVIANILCQTLIELKNTLIKSTKSTLILSGILSSDIKEIDQHFQPYFKYRRAMIQDEWACISYLEPITT